MFFGFAQGEDCLVQNKFCMGCFLLSFYHNFGVRVNHNQEKLKGKDGAKNSRQPKNP
eukprot:30383_6